MAVPQNNEGNNTELKKIYDRYLGIFNWLCIGIIGAYVLVIVRLIYTIQKKQIKIAIIPVVNDHLVFIGLLFLILLIVNMFKAPQLNQTLVNAIPYLKGPIIFPLRLKKGILFLALVLFLIAITDVTILNGGSCSSPFNELLGITGGIGAFLAFRRWTKCVIIFITMVAYYFASSFHYDVAVGISNYQSPELNQYLNWAIILIVLFVSAFSVEQKRPKDCEDDKKA